MDTHIELAFGDGEYMFRLPYAALAQIESAANATIGVVYARVMTGESGAAEVIEIIRHGLEGGKTGMVDGHPIAVTPSVANALVKRYVIGDDRRPFAESENIARCVISAFYQGYDNKKKVTIADPLDEST
jgi:Phage tail tube protein, GTA-gp10